MSAKNIRKGIIGDDVTFPLPSIKMSEMHDISSQNSSGIKNSIRRSTKEEEELRLLWKSLNARQRFIIILLAEYRVFSGEMLREIFLSGKESRGNACRGWISFINKKYGVDFDTNKLFTTGSPKSVYNKLIQPLVALKLIRSVTYITTPEMLNEHPIFRGGIYGITTLGGKLLITQTDTTIKDINVIATQSKFSASSAVHELNTNMFFINTLSTTNNAMASPTAFDDYGVLDFAKWEHEKDTIHPVSFDGSRLYFRPDGFGAIYSMRVGGFISFFLEFDSGSSREKNIKHKINTFFRYSTIAKEENNYGRPILLLVSAVDRDAGYENMMKKIVDSLYRGNNTKINDFITVAYTTTRRINEKSVYGKIWKVYDFNDITFGDELYSLIEIN